MADPRAQVNLGVATGTGVSSVATALAANRARCAFVIVNVGTNPLLVKYGDGASASDYSVPLKACTIAGDGTGGSLAMESNAMWTGIISVAGTSPSYIATELTA